MDWLLKSGGVEVKHLAQDIMWHRDISRLQKQSL